MLIRDSVHHDMYFTRLEKNIIDHPRFQEMRGVRQLGFARLVYPSANHTRFEHSLGVCYMTKKILGVLDQNLKERIIKFTEKNDANKLDELIKIWEPVSPKYIKLLPIIALLHDVGHIPFGHFLEDECKLFEYSKIKHDKGNRINSLTREILDSVQQELPSEISENEKQWIIGYIEGNPQILKNEFKWINQIITDTICADLLDYVKRDAFHLGMSDMVGYDDRIFRYFSIKHFETDENLIGKPGSFVIELTKNSETRHDAINNIMHLIESRYRLFEAVHLHHAKVAAAAMLGKAVRSLIDDEETKLIEESDGNINENDIRENAEREIHQKLEGHTDSSLIDFLRDSDESNETAKILTGSLKRRKLFKRIAMERNQGHQHWDGSKIFLHKQKDSRKIITETENEILKMLKKELNIEKDIENIIIIQPSGFTATKILKVPVLFEGQIKILKELNHRRDHGIGLLMDKYEELKRIYIFADNQIRIQLSQLDINKYNKIKNEIIRITQDNLGIRINLFPKRSK